MMDISQLVQYERAFPLELKHPVTGEKVGVTFNVRHIDCSAATAVVDRQSAGEVLEASSTDRSLEVLAACIESWDWGKHTFNGEKLELTPENALLVLKSSPWINRQVLAATGRIANFMNA